MSTNLTLNHEIDKEKDIKFSRLPLFKPKTSKNENPLSDSPDITGHMIKSQINSSLQYGKPKNESKMSKDSQEIVRATKKAVPILNKKLDKIITKNTNFNSLKTSANKVPNLNKTFTRVGLEQLNTNKANYADVRKGLGSRQNNLTFIKTACNEIKSLDNSPLPDLVQDSNEICSITPISSRTSSLGILNESMLNNAELFSKMDLNESNIFLDANLTPSYSNINNDSQSDSEKEKSDAIQFANSVSEATLNQKLCETLKIENKFSQNQNLMGYIRKSERPISNISQCSDDTGILEDVLISEYSENRRPISFISTTSTDTGYQKESNLTVDTPNADTPTVESFRIPNTLSPSNSINTNFKHLEQILRQSALEELNLKNVNSHMTNEIKVSEIETLKSKNKEKFSANFIDESNLKNDNLINNSTTISIINDQNKTPITSPINFPLIVSEIASDRVANDSQIFEINQKNINELTCNCKVEKLDQSVATNTVSCNMFNANTNYDFLEQENDRAVVVNINTINQPSDTNIKLNNDNLVVTNLPNLVNTNLPNAIVFKIEENSELAKNTNIQANDFSCSNLEDNVSIKDVSQIDDVKAEINGNFSLATVSSVPHLKALNNKDADAKNVGKSKIKIIGKSSRTSLDNDKPTGNENSRRQSIQNQNKPKLITNTITKDYPIKSTIKDKNKLFEIKSSQIQSAKSRPIEPDNNNLKSNNTQQLSKKASYTIVNKNTSKENSNGQVSPAASTTSMGSRRNSLTQNKDSNLYYRSQTDRRATIVASSKVKENTPIRRPETARLVKNQLDMNQESNIGSISARRNTVTNILNNKKISEINNSEKQSLKRNSSFNMQVGKTNGVTKTGKSDLSSLDKSVKFGLQKKNKILEIQYNSPILSKLDQNGVTEPNPLILNEIDQTDGILGQEMMRVMEMMKTGEKNLADLKEELAKQNIISMAMCIVVQQLFFKIESNNANGECIQELRKELEAAKIKLLASVSQRDIAINEMQAIKDSEAEKLKMLEQGYALEIKKSTEYIIKEKDDEIEKLVRNYEESMAKLTDEHSNQLTSMKLQQIKDRTELESDFDLKVRCIEEENRGLIQSIVREQEQQKNEITQRFEQIKIVLSNKVEELKSECDLMKSREASFRESCRRETDAQIQALHTKFGHQSQEIESLRSVLDLRNLEVHDLRHRNMELTTELEELPAARENIRRLEQKCENLEAIVDLRMSNEKELHEKHRRLLASYDKQAKANKRLSMDKDQLMWKLSHQDESSDERTLSRPQSAHIESGRPQSACMDSRSSSRGSQGQADRKRTPSTSSNRQMSESLDERAMSRKIDCVFYLKDDKNRPQILEGRDDLLDASMEQSYSGSSVAGDEAASDNIFSLDNEVSEEGESPDILSTGIKLQRSGTYDLHLKK